MRLAKTIPLEDKPGKFLRVARVERHAPCPVLIIRCEHTPGTETTLWREARLDPDRLQPETVT